LSENDLHNLEAELALLLKTRSEIDSQISEVEEGIKNLKQSFSSDSAHLFKDETLPDILDNSIDESRIIRSSSSIEDKYSLFVSLFAGRSDVHTQRFQRKNGSGGYSPVCANQFNSSFCPMSLKVNETLDENVGYNNNPAPGAGS